MVFEVLTMSKPASDSGPLGFLSSAFSRILRRFAEGPPAADSGVSFGELKTELSKSYGAQSPRLPVSQAGLQRLEELLAALGRSGEPEGLLSTLGGLTHPDDRIVAAAGEAAAGLLPLWPVHHWPRLDESLRRAWLELAANSRFWQSRSEAVVLVVRLPPTGAARLTSLILLASHDNGYVRQGAIVELASEVGPSLPAEILATLTLRLDDWVGVVAAEAWRLWEQLLPRAQPEVLVENLGLIGRLATHERVDDVRLWNAVGTVLRSAEGQQALVAGLKDRRAAVAGWAFKAMRRLALRPEGARDAAFASYVPLIRLEMARELVAAAGDEAGLELLRLYFDRIANDRFDWLRHLALDVATTWLPERLEELARKGLFDRAASVRSRCQEFLVMRFDVDPLPLYRECLDRGEAYPRHLAAALLGLTEVGDHRERPYFERFLADPLPNVRAAAIFGLGRLADPADGERFFPGLEDPTKQVRRASSAAIARQVWRVERLMAVFRTSTSVQARVEVYKLTQRLAAWDRVLLGFYGLEDGRPEVVQAAYSELHLILFGWMFAEPTADQRQELEALLRRHSGQLPQMYRVAFHFQLAQKQRDSRT